MHANALLRVSCARCHGTGFSGRVGVYELFIPTDAIRQAVSDEVTLQELRALAKEIDFTTLFMDGMDKVKSGMTTVEEVFRVCSS
jgi:type II secretory ATPase GspE/PulE/Tfp pilus assembly ATPase PilB-like protein